MTDLAAETEQRQSRHARTVWPLVLGAAVVVLELLILYFLYHPNRFIFECRALGSPLLCGLLSAGVLRTVAVAGAVVLYVLARPKTLAAIQGGLRPGWSWGALQLAGFVLILLPLAFLADGAAFGMFAGALGLWFTGLLAIGAGTIFFFVRPGAWAEAVRTAGPAALILVAVAFVLPDIGPWIRDKVQYLWHLDIVTEATFWSTAMLLETLGEQVFTDAVGPWDDEDIPGPYLGIGDFIVGVGRQCSGVEGFVLITSFMLIYFWLFRDRLRFPRVWLLLPVGIALSWCLNVVRIAILMWIGAYHSPELAIEGFHSHAGWLMFTVLSLSFAAGVHQIGWFRKDRAPVAAADRGAGAPRAERPAFFQDPVVAQIFPFIVFMASALLASTFSQTPAMLYPFRALAMAAALVLVWPVLRRIDWRLDPLALGAGAVIGVLWLITAPDTGTDFALSLELMTMPLWLFWIWVASRVIGTAVLVPVIEELFFRGYILRRLDTGGLAMRALALAVSAGLFAVLHDRWLAAGLAGLVFGLLALRQGRISDAILAHAMANAVIAAWAVAEGDWSVI